MSGQATRPAPDGSRRLELVVVGRGGECRHALGRRPKSLAFTLIETIIALSLTSVLLVLVWATFDVYTRYETKGVNAAEQTSLIRSLHRQFRDDLLNAVAVDPRRPVPRDIVDDSTTLSTRQFSSPGSSPLGPRSTSSTTQPAIRRTPENGYFVGTATDMHFMRFVIPDLKANSPATSLTPSSSISPVSGASGTSTSSMIRRPDPWLRVVSYEPRLLVEDDLDSDGSIANGTRDEEGDFGDDLFSGDNADDELDSLEFSSLDLALEPTPQGIDRRVRLWDEYLSSRGVTQQLGELTSSTPLAISSDDLMSVGSTGSGSNTLEQQLAKPEQIIDEIPEVRRLAFRYFDGSSWVSEWNSTISGTLPVAVEVALDLEMDHDAALTVEEQLEAARLPLESSLEPSSALSSSTFSTAATGAGLASISSNVVPAWRTDYRWLIATGATPRLVSGAADDLSDDLEVEADGSQSQPPQSGAAQTSAQPTSATEGLE